MRTRDVPDESTNDAPDQPEESPEICTVQTSPDRLLFSETDNPDGWIATDLVVDLER